MWIFGYGSLIWSTNFPYAREMAGFVKGYLRRFYQASPDHRGTFERPGRTVTLVPDPQGRVWGRAYEVSAENEAVVRQYLNYREKAGYGCEKVQFYPHPKLGVEPFEVEVYISPPKDNEYFIGPEPVTKIAERVITCAGPSGSNIEYVLRLAHGIRQLETAVEDADEHLAELEAEIIRLCRLRGIYDPVLSELGYGERSSFITDTLNVNVSVSCTIGNGSC